MCSIATVPEVKWFSSTDQTGHYFGLTCTKLAERPPGFSASSWYRFWKLLKLIETGL